MILLISTRSALKNHGQELLFESKIGIVFMLQLLQLLWLVFA